MQKPHVLLLFGGESSEHDVSIASARNVYAAISQDIFTVTLCYIDENGLWWLVEDVDGYQSITSGTPQLSPILGTGLLRQTLSDRTIRPDVMLPILHGKNGEDGAIAALGQLLHIPVVGCDTTASAACMDKVITKEVAQVQGISVVPYHVHREGEPVPNYSDIAAELGVPLFVKPSRAGSSVGVSKVESEGAFYEALTEAHRHDKTVLIEQGLSARELEVAVLGNPPAHQASVVGEIVADGEFYSYDSKYSDESASAVIIPAEIDEAITESIRAQALQVYAALGCAGLARVDFFVEKDSGNIFLNEINTLPGFTNISMYPKLWQYSGTTYEQLVEALIRYALASK